MCKKKSVCRKQKFGVWRCRGLKKVDNHWFRQTDRQIDRQTVTPTDRHTVRQTDRQIHN